MKDTLPITFSPKNCGQQRDDHQQAHCGIEYAIVPRKMPIEVVANRCSAIHAKQGQLAYD
jgi:hypothetical protein